MPILAGLRIKEALLAWSSSSRLFPLVVVTHSLGVGRVVPAPPRQPSVSGENTRPSWDCGGSESELACSYHMPTRLTRVIITTVQSINPPAPFVLKMRGIVVSLVILPIKRKKTLQRFEKSKSAP